MVKIKNTLPANLLFAAISLAVILYFFPHSENSHYKYEEGRPWNYAQLIAPFDIPIKTDSATVKAVRDSLDANAVPVFVHQPTQADSVITSLMVFWKSQPDENLTPHDAFMRQKTVTYLKTAYEKDVVNNEYGHRIEEGTLPTIKIKTNDDNTVHNLHTTEVISTDELYQGLVQHLGDSLASDWLEKNKIYDLLLPNLVYDEATTKSLYNYDLYRLTAIKGVIQQGQTIIDKGAIITPQDYTNLCTYEQMIEEQLATNTQSRWLVLLGQFLYVALLLAALMLYLRYSAPEVWRRRKSMIFIFMMITISFVIAVAADTFIDNGVYFVPFAIVPVLMIVFFDAPTALVTSMILILICAGSVTFPLEFITLETVASVAAIYSLKDLRQRLQLLRTSLLVLMGYLLAYTAIELMMNGSLEGFSWHIVTNLTLASVFSSVAYILMVGIERLFGFVSAVTLVELSDVNNPLLRQLSEECPGTFQHSMAVSTLATDAAIKIGANEQLVRAGALYHDIGKINNPNFFTENQRGVNPHDVLPPERSAQIIIKHIADGVASAEKAGLPAIIKDFIREHHGRGKARYFYYNYCKAHPDEEVDETLFTYPGPNPRSRETSLLMMADSVEAASRSLKEHTPEAITELVNRIIDSQIQEGLHNDSSLSFRDVKIIKNEFIRRLLTMYHARVQYPGQEEPTPDDTAKH